MELFAQVQNGIVINTISSDQDYINSGALGDPATFIQTDTHTRGNIHYDNDMKPDGGIPVRANSARVGDTYDEVNDVFYAPQPYPSWTISASTWLWQPPVSYPNDGQGYTWDEPTLSWALVPITTKE